MRDFYVPKDLLLFGETMSWRNDFSISGFSAGIAEDCAALTLIPGASVAKDPYWGNVTVCINPSGADGSTEVIDAKGNTLTVGGNAQIDTSLGYPTILFDGNADFVKIPAFSGIVFGSGNFTIDVHVRKVENVANMSRIWNNDGDYAYGIDAVIDSSGVLAIYASSNGTTWNLLSAPSVATLANNTDYFIRIVRDGGTLRCGVNGTVYTLSTTLSTAALYDGGRAICFGGQSVGISRSLNGHIRGLRVTKGVARDASEIQTLPFPTE